MACWGHRVLGLVAMPVAIAQYPEFFNENKWLLPGSVVVVLVCWLLPFALHDRTARWLHAVASVHARGYMLVVHSAKLLGGLVVGGRTLFRFHAKHLERAIAAANHAAEENKTRESLHIEGLPGFFGYAVVKLTDAPSTQRQYLMDTDKTQAGARASLYISASNLFTFSIADTHGESYPLEIELSKEGISLEKWIYLQCEAGISDGKTITAVSVNGQVVGSRVVNGPLDLGEGLGEWDFWGESATSATRKVQRSGVCRQQFNVDIGGAETREQIHRTKVRD